MQNNLNNTLQELSSKLGAVCAEWKTVLEKSPHTKNISIGEWNLLVKFASTTYSDVTLLKNAVDEVIKTIGTSDISDSTVASLTDAVDKLSAILGTKLPRIFLDENGNGADPTSTGEDAGKYNSIGTYSGVYVEHMGSDGEWRPMLRRLNAGDDVLALNVDHIPISDSIGRVRVTAPDGSISDTDFASSNSAIPRHYADNRYVRTIDSTSTMDRVYIKTSGGSNSNRPISAALTDGTASIPIRDKTSQNFHVGPTTKNNHPINATQLVSRLSLEFDRANYVMTLVYNAPEKVNGNTKVVLGTVDLPMESVVVNGRVESDYLYLELQNGVEIPVSIAGMINPIYDEFNEIRQDFVELQEFVTSELGDVLDEIIALQDYYTGAT